MVDVGATTVRRLGCRRETGPQRGRLGSHVGKKIDSRLLYSDIRGGRPVVVVRIETPGPLDGARTEDQGAAAMAIKGEAVGCRGRTVGRTVILQNGEIIERCRRKAHQPWRLDAVIGTRIPLVAERARRERRDLIRRPALRRLCSAKIGEHHKMREPTWNPSGFH